MVPYCGLIFEDPGVSVPLRRGKVAEFLKLCEDAGRTLLHCLPVGFYDQFGMQWLFVGIINTGEALDLALLCKLVEAFDIALAADFDGGLDVDFNEMTDMGARPISGLAVGGNGGGDAGHSVACKQATHEGNALDVGITIFPAETQSLAEVGAYVIAIQDLDIAPALL